MILIFKRKKKTGFLIFKYKLGFFFSNLPIVVRVAKQ